MDGFTISMWVRFLDKTSRGTLFNYGNPLRAKDPKGFMLETYVLNKDDVLSTAFPEDGIQTWGQAAEGTDLFSNSDSERFIRLVTYDHLPNVFGDLPFRRLYDSSKGIPGFEKTTQTVPEFGISSVTAWDESNEKGLLTHTRVPIDFKEWYFVVANFNPMVDDSLNYKSTDYNIDPNY